MEKTTRKPFSNCYVFAKVMNDNKELAQEVTRIAIDREVEDVEIIEVHPREDNVETRGIRSNVYLKAKGLIIALEMQAPPEPLLPLRERYHHAWLDKCVRGENDDFREIPDAYVVLICTSDPVSLGAAAYESVSFLHPRDGGSDEPFANGSHTVLLNASGDLSGAAPEMAELLQYVAGGAPGAPGSLPARLEAAVDKAYEDEKWVTNMSIMEAIKAARECDI